MQDRYGNSVTTVSAKAFELYQQGIDLFLAAQPGGIEHLEQATAEDEGFAIAYADLARALQIIAKPKEARAMIKRAVELMGGSSEQEKAHVAIMDMLINGQSAAGYEKIQEHVLTYPRDVMMVLPCCGVFGLIGFSGREGREAENLAFMASLASHYVGDWWFESLYAFALCEVGQLAQAEALNEKAFAANPTNANAVHHRAHIHYETGETEAGRSALVEWRRTYSREGLLHCHLAWHDALWALAMGEAEQAWEIVQADVHPDFALAPPINVMTDLVAVLLRSEFAGQRRRHGLWEVAADYASQHFASPGLSFADAHAAVAYAITDRTEKLDILRETSKGTASDMVSAIANAFTSFAAQDWQGTLDCLVPIMSSHERLGGSRAQRDLLDLTLAYALTQTGLAGEAERFLRTRRPETALDVFRA